MRKPLNNVTVFFCFAGGCRSFLWAGCDDFLSKPVNKVELLKRVRNMLKLHSVTDELERLRAYIDSMEAEQGPLK